MSEKKKLPPEVVHQLRSEAAAKIGKAENKGLWLQNPSPKLVVDKPSNSTDSEKGKEKEKEKDKDKK